MKPNPRPAVAVVLATLIAVLFVASPLLAQQKVEVTNNQPFPIVMPVKLLGEDATAAATVMVNVEANGKQTIDLGAKPAPGGARAQKVSVEPADNGVHLKSGDRDLGT